MNHIYYQVFPSPLEYVFYNLSEAKTKNLYTSLNLQDKKKVVNSNNPHLPLVFGVLYKNSNSNVPTNDIWQEDHLSIHYKIVALHQLQVLFFPPLTIPLPNYFSTCSLMFRFISSTQHLLLPLEYIPSLTESFFDTFHSVYHNISKLILPVRYH